MAIFTAPSAQVRRQDLAPQPLQNGLYSALQIAPGIIIGICSTSGGMGYYLPERMLKLLVWDGYLYVPFEKPGTTFAVLIFNATADTFGVPAVICGRPLFAYQAENPDNIESSARIVAPGQVLQIATYVTAEGMPGKPLEIENEDYFSRFPCSPDRLHGCSIAMALRKAKPLPPPAPPARGSYVGTAYEPTDLLQVRSSSAACTLFNNREFCSPAFYLPNIWVVTRASVMREVVSCLGGRPPEEFSDWTQSYFETWYLNKP